MINKKILVSVLSLMICNTVYAGYPVIDASLIATVQTQTATLNGSITSVNGSIVSMNTNLAQLLTRVGTAVTQGSDKIVTTISSDGDSTRKFMVSQQKSERSYQAQKSFSISANICADSASSGLSQSTNKASSVKGSSRPGANSNITNQAIKQHYNDPPEISEIDSAVVAKIHSQYCDVDDYKAYGNSKACEKVSDTMPGADKRIDTVLIGAGKNDKSVDLTFTQEQTDAAYAYIQNSMKRSISPALRKGEADSVAGSQYIGYMTQYNSIISAATDPLEQLVASSQPDDDATKALKDSLSDPSAKEYWKLSASDSSKKTGKVSMRELEQFDINRRYANPSYNGDLYQMTGENLTRELIRVQVQNNYFQKQIKDELVKNNILTGMMLANKARAEYTPILAAQYQKVTNSLAGRK